MPYLIDGHNLIPKSGIRLDSPDDELELLAVLQEFARRERRDIEVYFDGAPPGSSGPRRFGRVVARFVRRGSTADAAIKARLGQLGRSARNWTVVSSDGEVRAAARNAHARSLGSDEFAAEVQAALAKGERAGAGTSRDDRAPSETEIEQWLKIFKREE